MLFIILYLSWLMVNEICIIVVIYKQNWPIFHVSHLKPCHVSVASHPVFAILLHMLASTVFSIMMSFGRGSVRIFGFLFSALALFLFSSALIIPYKINPMWLSIQNSWHFIAIHILSGWVELCSKWSWLIRIHTII
jgi:hypothetical protein